MEYPDSIHAEFTHLGGISAMKTTLIHFKITIALTIIVVCCLTICAVSASESSTTGFSSVVWTPRILTPVTYPVSNSDLIQAAQARTGSVALATQGVSPGTANTESTGGPSQEAYHVGILPLTSPWLTPGISPVKLPSLNSISTIPNSTFTIPTWIPLAPTDPNQTGSGQTSSGKGSLVILGPGGAQGYIINLKSNFYDPQAILGADGLWHTGMGVTPEELDEFISPGFLLGPDRRSNDREIRILHYSNHRRRADNNRRSKQRSLPILFLLNQEYLFFAELLLVINGSSLLSSVYEKNGLI